MADQNNHGRNGRRSNEENSFRNRGGALDLSGGSFGERPPRRTDRQRQPGTRAPQPYQSPNTWRNDTPGSQAGPYSGYGPRGYRRSDERILEDIRNRLTQHAEIDASEIEVKVDEGEVTLTGVVADRRIKRLVEANVLMIPGVVDVVNELGLRNPPTSEEIAAEKTAKEMADKFPGGPTPTGNAGY